MKKITLLLLLFFTLKIVTAQEEKFKALFLYNFTKNIEWPNVGQTEFEIGIIGNSNVYDEMLTIAQKGKVGNLPLVIKKYNSIDQIQNSKIIFISNNKNAVIANAVAKFASKPVVIVTENSGSTYDGVSIRFVMIDDKLKFEISRKNTQKNGMKVNSSLFGLGKEIN